MNSIVSWRAFLAKLSQIVLCDVQTWKLLRHDLQLPRPEVRAILIDLIGRLVG